MTEDELSWEERNHLYNLSVISFLIVVFAIAIFEVHLLETRPLTLLDGIIWLALPAAILAPTAWLVTYEVLYYRRTRKSGAFHAKRLIRRVLGTLAIELPVFAVVIASIVVFSGKLSLNGTFYLSFGLGALILLIVVFVRTRTRSPSF